MKKLDYLVVGTGRCGTVFLARLLTSLGIPCGHECCFDWRGMDYAKIKLQGLLPIETSSTSTYDFRNGEYVALDKWLDESKIVAESSYMVAPFLKSEIFADTKIIHLVRNPIKVINSFVNYLNYFQNRHPSLWFPAKKYESFIFYHCPDLYLDMSPQERAALYYVRWNQMIETNLSERDYLFHRIEDGSKPIMDFTEKNSDKIYDNDKVNSFEKPTIQFNLDQLSNGNIKRELIDMSEGYGYDITSSCIKI